MADGFVIEQVYNPVHFSFFGCHSKANFCTSSHFCRNFLTALISTAAFLPFPPTRLLSVLLHALLPQVLEVLPQSDRRGVNPEGHPHPLIYVHLQLPHRQSDVLDDVGVVDLSLNKVCDRGLQRTVQSLLAHLVLSSLDQSEGVNDAKLFLRVSLPTLITHHAF